MCLSEGKPETLDRSKLLQKLRRRSNPRHQPITDSFGKHAGASNPVPSMPEFPAATTVESPAYPPEMIIPAGCRMIESMITDA